MKKRKFSEGGGTSVDEDPIGGVADFESQNSPESKVEAGSVDFGKPAGKGSISAVAAKPKGFKSAFADARASGDKTFEWNGKKYSTAVASEAASTPKPAPSSTEKAYSTEGRGKEVAAKPKYQSLQDRAGEYAAKRKESGVGMYGTSKSVKEPRSVTSVASADLKGPYKGMGTDYKPKMRGGESFAKGGGVKGWGQARGSRAAKIV